MGIVLISKLISLQISFSSVHLISPSTGDFSAFILISAFLISKYILFRGTRMVLHIPSHVFLKRELFESIMDDICILHLLGIQLILVAGVREQVDSCTKIAGNSPYYYSGMRVTDELALQCLKEMSGSIRSSIESSLTRGFRGRPGQTGIQVVSGNSFYSAKPLGVRQGIDFK